MAQVKNPRVPMSEYKATIARLQTKLRNTEALLQQQQIASAGAQALVKAQIRESDAFEQQLVQFRILIAALMLHQELDVVDIPDKIMLRIYGGEFEGVDVQQLSNRKVKLSLVKKEVSDGVITEEDPA